MATITFLTMNSTLNTGAKGAKTDEVKPAAPSGGKPSKARLSASAISGGKAPLLSAGAERLDERDAGASALRKSERTKNQKPLTQSQQQELEKKEAAEKRREEAKAFSNKTRAMAKTPASSPRETPQATPIRVYGKSPPVKTELGIDSATPLRPMDGGESQESRESESSFDCEAFAESPSIPFHGSDASCHASGSKETLDRGEEIPRASPSPEAFPSFSHGFGQRSMVSMETDKITPEFREIAIGELRLTELRNKQLEAAEEMRLVEARNEQSEAQKVMMQQILDENARMKAVQAELLLKNAAADEELKARDEELKAQGDMLQSMASRYRSSIGCDSTGRESGAQESRLESSVSEPASESLAFEAILRVQAVESENSKLLEEAMKLGARIERLSTIRANESILDSLSPDARRLSASFALSLPESGSKMFMAEGWVAWKRYMQYMKAEKEADMIYSAKMDSKRKRVGLMGLWGHVLYMRKVNPAVKRLLRRVKQGRDSTTLSIWARNCRLQKKYETLVMEFKWRSQVTRALLSTVLSCFRTCMKMGRFIKKTIKAQMTGIVRGWGAHAQKMSTWGAAIREIHVKRTRLVKGRVLLSWKKWAVFANKAVELMTKFGLRLVLAAWRIRKSESKAEKSKAKADALAIAASQDSITAGIAALALASPGSAPSPMVIDSVGTQAVGPVTAVDTVYTQIECTNSDLSSPELPGLVVNEAMRLMSRQQEHLCALFDSCDIICLGEGFSLMHVITYLVTELSNKAEDTPIFNPRPVGSHLYINEKEVEFVEMYITPRGRHWNYGRGYNGAIVALILARMHYEVPLWYTGPAPATPVSRPPPQQLFTSQAATHLATPQATPQATPLATPQATPLATPQTPQATPSPAQTFQPPATFQASTSTRNRVILDEYGMPCLDY